MLYEAVNKETCNAKHEAISEHIETITRFMEDWNSRWITILISIITGLFIMVTSLMVTIWNMSPNNFSTPQVHASENINK